MLIDFGPQFHPKHPQFSLLAMFGGSRRFVPSLRSPHWSPFPGALLLRSHLQAQGCHLAGAVTLHLKACIQEVEKTENKPGQTWHTALHVFHWGFGIPCQRSLHLWEKSEKGKHHPSKYQTLLKCLCAKASLLAFHLCDGVSLHGCHAC